MKRVSHCLIIAFTCFSLNALSQTSAGLGLGVLRVTDEGSDVLIGGEAYLKKEVTEAVRVGVTIGFYTKSELVFGNKFRLSGIPITVGGEYLFLQNNFRPYVGFNVGLHGTMASANNSSNTEFDLLLTPIVGAEYGINKNLGVNINFKYNFIFYRNELTEGPDFFSLVSPNLGVFYRL